MSNINLETIRIGGRCEKHVSMLPCVQCDNERLRAALAKAEQERDQYREETRWQGRRIRELTDERAALAAQEPLAHVVLTVSGVYRPATEVERRCSSGVFPIFAAAGAAPDLVKLITQLHRAKGRYHTQLAVCDLFDAVGLKNERPTK